MAGDGVMARGPFITRDERVTIAMLAISGYTDSEIAQMCGRDRSKVSLHRRRLSIPVQTRRTATVPDDFTDIARTTRTDDLANRYERSPRTIRRWRRSLGLKPAQARRIIKHVKRTLWAKTPTFSHEERAANVLRRHFASVFRCDLRMTERSQNTYGSLRGLPNRGAGHWFVARLGIVDLAAMLAKARELGFAE